MMKARENVLFRQQGLTQDQEKYNGLCSQGDKKERTFCT